MNCAEYLVDFLISKKVTDIFGYSGGYIVPFIESLRKRNEINVHICYNEQGCAFAANAFSRISGKIGVYFTTSGPGAINALGGLADAWFDGIPVMGICANVPTYEYKGDMGIRQNGFQEMDIVSITKSITKYSVTSINAQDFSNIVATAYKKSMEGRKGGVIIDFPFDIQKTSVDCR